MNHLCLLKTERFLGHGTFQCSKWDHPKLTGVLGHLTWGNECFPPQRVFSFWFCQQLSSPLQINQSTTTGCGNCLCVQSQTKCCEGAEFVIRLGSAHQHKNQAMVGRSVGGCQLVPSWGSYMAACVWWTGREGVDRRIGKGLMDGRERSTRGWRGQHGVYLGDWFELSPRGIWSVQRQQG